MTGGAVLAAEPGTEAGQCQEEGQADMGKEGYKIVIMKVDHAQVTGR